MPHLFPFLSCFIITYYYCQLSFYVAEVPCCFCRCVFRMEMTVNSLIFRIFADHASRYINDRFLCSSNSFRNSWLLAECLSSLRIYFNNDIISKERRSRLSFIVFQAPFRLQNGNGAYISTSCLGLSEVQRRKQDECLAARPQKSFQNRGIQPLTWHRDVWACARVQNKMDMSAI